MTVGAGWMLPSPRRRLLCPRAAASRRATPLGGSRRRADRASSSANASSRRRSPHRSPCPSTIGLSHRHATLRARLALRVWGPRRRPAMTRSGRSEQGRFASAARVRRGRMMLRPKRAAQRPQQLEAQASPPPARAPEPRRTPVPPSRRPELRSFARSSRCRRGLRSAARPRCCTTCRSSFRPRRGAAV